MALAREGSSPQGLKPAIYALFHGTAEAVPFQNPILATSSKVLPDYKSRVPCGGWR
jgi:hypothetical protein